MALAKRIATGKKGAEHVQCYLLPALREGHPLINTLAGGLLGSPYDWSFLSCTAKGAAHIGSGPQSILKRIGDKVASETKNWNDERLLGETETADCDIDIFYFALRLRGFGKKSTVWAPSLSLANARVVCRALKAAQFERFFSHWVSRLEDLGCWEALLSVMEAFMGDDQVQEDACHVIRQLLDCNGWMHLSKFDDLVDRDIASLRHRKDTILNRCTLNTLKILERYSSNPSVVGSAASCIQAIDSELFVGEGILLAVGGVEHMLSAAKSHPGSVDLQLTVLRFLRKLTKPSAGTWDFEHEVSLPNCQLIASAGGTVVILQALRLHLVDSVQKEAYAILGDMLKAGEGASQFSSAGLRANVSSIITGRITRSSHANFWRALRYYSTFKESTHFFSESIVEDLIGLMDRDDSYKHKILRHGGMILGSVIRQECLSTLVIERGLPIVVRGMEDHADNGLGRKIDVPGCFILSKAMSVQRVDSLRHIAAVVKALHRSWFYDGVVRYGLDYLSQCCKYPLSVSQMASLNCVRHVLSVMKDHVDDGDAPFCQTCALRILKALLAHEECQQQMMSLEAPKRIVQAMRENKQSSEVQALGMNILKCLSSRKEVAESNDSVLLTASVLLT